jgi:hypothetical protein
MSSITKETAEGVTQLVAAMDDPQRSAHINLFEVYHHSHLEAHEVSYLRLTLLDSIVSLPREQPTRLEPHAYALLALVPFMQPQTLDEEQRAY